MAWMPPNMGIGGITPAQKLNMLPEVYFCAPLKRGGLPVEMARKGEAKCRKSADFVQLGLEQPADHFGPGR